MTKNLPMKCIKIVRIRSEISLKLDCVYNNYPEYWGAQRCVATLTGKQLCHFHFYLLFK